MKKSERAKKRGGENEKGWERMEEKGQIVIISIVWTFIVNKSILTTT